MNKTWKTRLLWLPIILLVWIGLPAIMTQPIGAIFHHWNGWAIVPGWAFLICGFFNWLAFLPLLK